MIANENPLTTADIQRALERILGGVEGHEFRIASIVETDGVYSGHATARRPGAEGEFISLQWAYVPSANCVALHIADEPALALAMARLYSSLIANSLEQVGWKPAERKIPAGPSDKARVPAKKRRKRQTARQRPSLPDWF